VIQRHAQHFRELTVGHFPKRLRIPVDRPSTSRGNPAAYALQSNGRTRYTEPPTELSIGHGAKRLRIPVYLL